MMFKPENLKIIAGATIIITAFTIMLQGVLGFVFSLARLGLVILIAIVVSSGLAFMYQVLVKGKKAASPSNIQNGAAEAKLED